MAVISRGILFFLIALCYVKADSIDRGLKRGVILKLLRDMANQTKADTLNLPANATSIRENITDTFSCENRTYGYYADVDNDCQVFHVCLTSQSAGGRSATYRKKNTSECFLRCRTTTRGFEPYYNARWNHYNFFVNALNWVKRWSFICPNETIFNQAALTCTRPLDSIDCEDAPMYYDINMEIGKVPNDNETDTNNNDINNNIDNSDTNNANANTATKLNKDAERIKSKKQTNLRKQNIIQNMLNEVKKQNMNPEDLEDIASIDNIEDDGSIDKENNNDNNFDNSEVKIQIPQQEIKKVKNHIKKASNKIKKDNPQHLKGEVMMEARPVRIEEVIPGMVEETEKISEEAIEDSRFAMERSLKRLGRYNRGSFRFKADV